MLSQEHISYFLHSPAGGLHDRCNDLSYSIFKQEPVHFIFYTFFVVQLFLAQFHPSYNILKFIVNWHNFEVY